MLEKINGKSKNATCENQVILAVKCVFGQCNL